MSKHENTPASGADRPDFVEELVARCLERGGDSASVDAICAEHPAHEPEIRTRLAKLASFGMLGGASDGAPEVDGFTVLGRLGAGGMAVVLAAREHATGDVVALKLADARLAWSERARERFRREIDAARRLDHPSVVRVRGSGESRGVPWYAMDLVPGATLAELLADLRRAGLTSAELRPGDLRAAWRARRVAVDGGPFVGGVGGVGGTGGDASSRSPELASEPQGEWGRTFVEFVARVALEVAEALAHAHDHGVVHRDVKPANVLVDAHGRALLFDLGLAHLADDPRLTRTGDFAGSPQYAAPEQVEGGSGGAGAIDARTDVHGLGVTLFELVALRPPFEGKSTPELLRKIQRADAPPLRRLAPWAPADLEAIVSTCLAKDPAERYQSASELADDLRRFLGFLPVRARPAGVVRRAVRLARANPAPSTALALALVILIASPLALWLHGRTVAGQRDRATLAAAEARREADENREVSRFLESLILGLGDEPAGEGGPGNRAAARELIDGARDRLAEGGDIQPLTRASLFHTVARVLAESGRALDAIPLLDRSLAIRSGELGESHAETVTTLAELANAHLALGNVGSARGLAERGMRAALAARPDGEHGGEHEVEPLPRALAAEALGRVERADGRLQVAVEHLEDAAARLRALGAGNERDAARVLRELSRAHLERAAELDGEGARRELDLALEHAQAAATLQSTLWEADPAGLAAGALLRADVRAARGEDDAEAAQLQAAVTLHKRRGAGPGADTEALLERLVPLLERRRGRGAIGVEPDLSESLVLLGELRRQNGSSGVESAFTRALEVAGDAPSDLSSVVGRAHLGLAHARFDAGLSADARRSIDAARAVQRELASPEPWIADLFELSLRAAAERGDEARIAADAAAARAWFDTRLESGAAPSPRLIASLRVHALLMLELERPGDAAAMLRGAEAAERRLGEGATPPGLALAERGDGAFDACMQDGVTFLQSRRYADAARAFEQGRALRPEHPIAWYNVACARARLFEEGPDRPDRPDREGGADAAFDALLRSVELGYAYRDRAEELTAADPDLAPLHGDPRFALVLERIRALRDAADAYASKPLLHVPAGIAEDEPAPLLVVLHGNGKTKRTVIDGPWREVADELGFVLLAPSGRIPSGTEPSQGMQWIDDPVRYDARSWYFEQPVRDAVAELLASRAIDPERVYLAGEDLGGTLAFHVAVHAPETYRGCVLVDAVAPLDLAADVAPGLGLVGLRIALLVDVEARPPGMPHGRSAAEQLSLTFRQLGEWGLETTLATRSGGTGESAPRLIEAIRFLERGRAGER